MNDDKKRRILGADERIAQENNPAESFFDKKITRRKAIGTGAAAGLAVVGLVVGAGAGYFAGTSAAAGGTTTKTQTVTVSGTLTGGGTVTETVTSTVGGGGGGEPQTITVMTLSNATVADSLKFGSTIYESTHPGVKINNQLIDEATMNAQVVAAIPNAPPPDIFYNSTLPAFNAQVVDPGYALSLDSYATKYGWADEMLSPWKTYQVNGHAYWFVQGFIYFGNIYYNADLFSKLNIKAPLQTMDDLYAAAATLKQNNLLPLVHGYQTQPEWFMNTFSDWTMNALSSDDYDNLWQFYGPKLKTTAFANRPIKWTDDKMTPMWQMVADWRDKVFAAGTPTNTDQTAVQLFTSQKAGMYMIGSWGVGALQAPVGSAFNFDFVPLITPATNGGNKRMVIFGQTYFIYSKTKSPNLCADFLNSMLTPNYQAHSINADGNFPIVNLGPGAIKGDKLAKSVLQSTQLDYRFSLAGGIATELHDPFEQALGGILAGSTTPQQAATDIENLAIQVNKTSPTTS